MAINYQGQFRDRDSYRTALYKAERECGVVNWKVSEPVSIEIAQKYVDSIVKSPWFKKHYRSVTYIKVKPGRGGGVAYWRSISLGVKARRCEGVIIHEIAHICAEADHSHAIAHHGEEFATTYLTLVKRFLGKEKYEALRLAFIRNGVPFKAKP